MRLDEDIYVPLRQKACGTIQDIQFYPIHIDLDEARLLFIYIEII